MVGQETKEPLVEISDTNSQFVTPISNTCPAIKNPARSLGGDWNSVILLCQRLYVMYPGGEIVFADVL